MIVVKLIASPIPGLCIAGENKFLGTVRPNMHKASLTALSAGLVERLDESGVHCELEIVDMQIGDVQFTKYGILDYENLVIEKHRVGIPFENIKLKIVESDIIGLSANFTHSRKIITDLASYCKVIKKNIILIIGGADATSNPLYYLKYGADIIVKGEGEITFQLLIERIHFKKDFESVPNIVYKSKSGKIKVNRINYLKQQFNIEKMNPPNLDIVDLSKYTDTGEGKPPISITPPFISVETSRGCFHSCSFCTTPQMKGRYRYMKENNINKHFEYFKSKGINTILFQEDNILSRIWRKKNSDYFFNNGRKELIDIFKIARNMEFNWEFTNGLELGLFENNGIIDDELIHYMFWNKKDNRNIKGCYRASIPLENLTKSNILLFRKLKPFDSMKTIIKILSELNLEMLSFNLIIGRPQDDEITLRKTFLKCLEIKELFAHYGNNTQIYFNIYNLALIPGTIDSIKFQNLLAFDLEKDPEVITFYLGCLRTGNFSPLEITQARGTLVQKLNDNSLIKDYDNTFNLTHKRFYNLFK
ncbi:MAG: radical SAM protein [Bacteroidetes bacterium]|nr:MAG: radical SAM protein [Bacteroidota bacterium]